MRQTIIPILFLSTMLSAQAGKAPALGDNLNDPKFPNGGHLIDVTATTSNTAALGCASAVVGGKRFYYATARRATGAKCALFKFDETGKLVATIDQPLTRGSAAPGISPWGIRDLAWDGGKYLYGGAESSATGNTVYAFDVTTDKWDATADWKAPGSVSTVRALAYDSNGDGGKGSLWTGNFSAACVEFDKTGKQLRSVPANNLVSAAQTASFYGAGYDPERKTVWWWSQGGSLKGRTAQTGVRVVGFEMSTATLQATGLVVFGDRTLPPSNSTTTPMGGIAGGCEFYIKNGRPTLLCLTQSASDSMYEINPRFNFGTRCGGEIGFKGGAPFGGNTTWEVKLENAGTATGNASLLIAIDDLTIPGSPPLFKSGCFIHANITGPLLAAGPTPIANNAASIKLPIPASVITGTATFQWVEFPAGGALPLTLSDGGKTQFWQ